ncbi:MAG: hypothetical protein DI549_00670 [Ancylobacter novellus]|uniref:Uncharacterized protein n=1 Tax=Ancylobacter novellus TaxID=921 RepID=A0A2W5R7F4_ANCNO|nr:MAG: hypothetical protein DI549_00670 [Ancylobacter novellus]
MHTPCTIPPLTPRPCADRETKARLARSYDERLQVMAKDVEHILARQDNVTPDDLALLGWTSAEIVEMSPEALNIVRARATRHAH